MAPSTTRRTYRVRQIPASCSQFHDLVRLLTYVLGYHKTITVRSLASSIDLFESPPTKVATVTFEDEPERLQSGYDSARSEWSVEAAFSPRNLIFDLHFRGFTPLNEVDSDHHILDCIAISGLAGHAYGSWCAEDRSVDFMWLRDALPGRYPCMRVSIYGYDSYLVGSQSFQSIREISLALITKLKSVGFTEPSSKPIVFLAHSLGGIVVKEAIAQMANSPPLEATLMRKLKGVVFFGVPNRGMKISHLLPLVEHQPNAPLVQSLAEGSPYLEHLDLQFHGISLMRQIVVVSIYETRKSPTPKLSSDGEWRKDGPFEILVRQESAIQRGTKVEYQHPINKDHSHLVKFNENEDELTPILYFMRPLYESLEYPTRVGRAHQSKSATFTAESVVEPTSEPVATLLSVEQRQQTLQSILDSIDFEDAGYRYAMIEEAHTKTFDWIAQHPRVGIIDWLRWGTGIFWISGKPGSGKSTAMKYIYRLYSKSLDQNPYGVSPQEIAARFFFHQRGSVMQKSFEGLLRSLLHQILQKIGLACETIFPEWFKPSARSPQEWSFHRLDRVWDRLMEQTHLPLNLILFLDALDEFDGSTKKVSSFIQKTARRPSDSMTQLRICCASRPWDTFADTFKSSSTFRMEDHTGPDIRLFVMDEMSAHEAVKPWLHSPISVERQSIYDLINEILNQAKGVFVWVKLVLQLLLDARTEGANIEELRRMIDLLPRELEDLYQALMARVRRPDFRREAYAMLEILIRSPRPLQLTEFAWILQCALANDLQHGVQGLQQIGDEMSAAEVDTLSRRIKSRCGGLVEIVAQSRSSNESTKRRSGGDRGDTAKGPGTATDSGKPTQSSAEQQRRTEFDDIIRPLSEQAASARGSMPVQSHPLAPPWMPPLPPGQLGIWHDPKNMRAYPPSGQSASRMPQSLPPTAFGSFAPPFPDFYTNPYISMGSTSFPIILQSYHTYPGPYIPGHYSNSYIPWAANANSQIHLGSPTPATWIPGLGSNSASVPFQSFPNFPSHLETTSHRNYLGGMELQRIDQRTNNASSALEHTSKSSAGTPQENGPSAPVLVTTTSVQYSSERGSIYMVQLMHQSVKEFVTSPDFKGSLGIDHNDTETENGHSFLAKFAFSLIKSTGRRRGKVISSIPWLTAEKAHKMFALCADSFHNAEHTTGFAQSTLLDDLDIEQFTSYFPQQRYDLDDEANALNDYRPRR